MAHDDFTPEETLALKAYSPEAQALSPWRLVPLTPEEELIRREAPQRPLRPDLDMWGRIRPYLTDTEYEVILAIYRDDQRVQDIADERGITHQAVYAAKGRALKRLREEMDVPIR